MMELWKSKGSQSLIANYRDITACDQDAKTLGSHDRISVLQATGSMLIPTAMGSGFHGGAL